MENYQTIYAYVYESPFGYRHAFDGASFTSHSADDGDGRHKAQAFHAIRRPDVRMTRG